jgi:hypothetical protein
MRGVRQEDYVVDIGFDICVLTSLTDNILRCKPPFSEPSLNDSSDLICGAMKLNPITVRNFLVSVLY